MYFPMRYLFYKKAPHRRAVVGYRQNDNVNLLNNVMSECLTVYENKYGELIIFMLSHLPLTCAEMCIVEFLVNKFFK